MGDAMAYVGADGARVSKQRQNLECRLSIIEKCRMAAQIRQSSGMAFG